MPEIHSLLVISTAHITESSSRWAAKKILKQERKRQKIKRNKEEKERKRIIKLVKQLDILRRAGLRLDVEVHDKYIKKCSCKICNENPQIIRHMKTAGLLQTLYVYIVCHNCEYETGYTIEQSVYKGWG